MVDGIQGVGQLLSARNVGRALMTRQEFMEVLSAQLRFQDPFAPMDNSEFLKQLVALEEIQSSAALTDGMSSFMNFFQLSIASGAIGKTIRAISEDGFTFEAPVDRVVVEDGEVLLGTPLGTVPFSSVMEVKATPEAPLQSQ
jgi:flagellar basal-body rod modification protein FlgD